MADITVILRSIQQGNASTDDLMPMVYDELRRLAAGQMHNERPGQTLQATALVHEAFLRLLGNDQPTWENRRHFFGTAARAMQRILVDKARQKKRLKHGGDHHRIELSNLNLVADSSNDDDQLIALSDAMERLDTTDSKKAELVRLRYFAGLTEEEAAQAMGISRATAARWWAFAKAWLFDQLKENSENH